MSHSPGKVSSRRIYTGRVVSLDLDRVRFPNGDEAEMELFRHPGAAAVVPILSDASEANPEVLLIRQYRYAADGYLYEIPAGRLDRNEPPERCARRELREETGYDANVVQPMASIYMTPGFTDERIHFFRAEGLSEGAHAREADEFIELHRVRLSRALGMVRSGEIQDAKTVIGLLLLDGQYGKPPCE